MQSAADIPQAAATLAAKVDCINNFTDNNVVNTSACCSPRRTKQASRYTAPRSSKLKGCLASESLDYVALGEETGKLAGQVLGGADAGSIPVAV